MHALNAPLLLLQGLQGLGGNNLLHDSSSGGGSQYHYQDTSHCLSLAARCLAAFARLLHADAYGFN